MANYIATRVSGTNRIVHTGSGLLYALLASHAETTAQVVSLYDGLAETGEPLLRIYVAAEQSPYFLNFQDRLSVPFITGLTVQPGNCEVNLWLVGR